MPIVLDWPEDLPVSGCSFQPVARVAHSRGLFDPDGFMEDLGDLWTARIEVETAPSRGEWGFGRLQSYLRSLRGGVNLSRIWDVRYCRPMGTARTREDWGRIAGRSRHEGGGKLGPVAEWRAQGGVVFAEAAGAGATDLRLMGGFPGDRAILPWDRITIGAAVYIVAEAERVEAAANFALRIFDGLQSAAEAGTPVLLGGRFSKIMRWTNPEAIDNFSRAGAFASQSLEFQEYLGTP